jgi:predicted molibdopterin-dependent oxidoreductase YjgC
MDHNPAIEKQSSQDQVMITVNGHGIPAKNGDNLSAVLWANGYVSFGTDPITGAERSVYCGIGHCGQCLVTVDGIEDQRACRLKVRDGMQIELSVADGRAEDQHEH